jgi:hypothetical protein
MQVDGSGFQDIVDHFFPGGVAEPMPILKHLLALWESHHGCPAPKRMAGALLKVVLARILSGDSHDDILEKGTEMMTRRWGVTDDQHHDGDGPAQESEKMKLMKRRSLALAPVQITTISASEAEEAIASPVDDRTRKLLQGLTAPSSQGKSLSEDFEEALTSPPPPTDASANFALQLIDGPLLQAATDEYSEVGSTFSDDETATGPISESHSAPGTGINQGDWVPSKQQDEEPPHLKD